MSAIVGADSISALSTGGKGAIRRANMEFAPTGDTIPPRMGNHKGRSYT